MKFLGQDFALMPRKEWWLMMLWFILGIGAPAYLAWKGFVFFFIILWLYIATKNAVNGFIQHPSVPIVFRIPFSSKIIDWSFTLPTNEKWTRFLFNLSITSFALVILPVALFGFGSYLSQAITHMKSSSPALLDLAGSAVNFFHGLLPNVVPTIDTSTAEGLKQFMNEVGNEIAGSSQTQMKEFGITVSGEVATTIAHTLFLWVEAAIAAIILSLFYHKGDDIIRVHRMILSNGIVDEQVQKNVLDLGERIQTMMEQFFVGWVKIAGILLFLYSLSLTALPLRLSLSQVIFLVVVLGLLTSIFKIGGMVAVAVGTLLILLNLEQGMGWWWLPSYTFSSGSLPIDTGFKILFIIAAIQSKGLVESYMLTPGIIAEKLQIPKVFIILAVVPWAIGYHLMGMAIGLNIMFLIFSLWHMTLGDEERALMQ
jgi:hypothetical protein